VGWDAGTGCTNVLHIENGTPFSRMWHWGLLVGGAVSENLYWQVPADSLDQSLVQ
jgi:hypothetical protein